MCRVLGTKRERTTLTTTSTPFSTFVRRIRFAMLVAKLVVSSVVVLKKRWSLCEKKRHSCVGFRPHERSDKRRTIKSREILDSLIVRDTREFLNISCTAGGYSIDGQESDVYLQLRKNPIESSTATTGNSKNNPLGLLAHILKVQHLVLWRRRQCCI